MKKLLLPDHKVIPLFILTLASFLIFFFYMANAAHSSVYQPDPHAAYGSPGDIQMEMVSDPDTPLGVKKVYRWTLDPDLYGDNHLCLHIAHHRIQIYFGDELMYSLTEGENPIGKNVSSNWCAVHIGPQHAGKEATVILTPLFEAAMGKNPDLLQGSLYVVAIDLLRSELPLMVCSALCVLVGVFMTAVSLYFRYIVKVPTNGMAFLGLFSVFLGLWKITDLSSLPLILPEDSMALGYISVGSLFLTGPCLLLYFSTLFSKEHQGLQRILACVSSVVCLVILAIQLLGITEIRQNLVYCHLLLIVSIISMPVASIYNRVVYHDYGLRPSWRLLLLPPLGIAVDLVYFYRNNSNGVISFTVLAFMIYTLIIFLSSVQNATRKSYTDSHTGLVNRARWNELMRTDISLPEPYGILVIDLNGLKRVNDTLGHEAGDQMIFQLSCIMRNSLPRNSVICRWGGDEFTVLLTAVSRSKLDQYMESLFSASEKYNTEHPELPIHFALGAALSSENPGIARTELFRLADEEMYRNKQQWYAHR